MAGADLKMSSSDFVSLGGLRSLTGQLIRTMCRRLENMNQTFRYETFPLLLGAREQSPPWGVDGWWRNETVLWVLLGPLFTEQHLATYIPSPVWESSNLKSNKLHRLIIRTVMETENIYYVRHSVCVKSTSIQLGELSIFPSPAEMSGSYNHC